MTKSESGHQDPHAAERRVLQAFWEQEPAALAQLREVMWDEHGRLQVEPPLIPPGFEHVRCGAKTRKGTACAARRLWPPSYRCEMHGGLSWRPHTARARARDAAPSTPDALAAEGHES